MKLQDLSMMNALYERLRFLKAQRNGLTNIRPDQELSEREQNILKKINAEIKEIEFKILDL